MGYRTVLIGTDGSITAREAQAAAMAVAKRAKARLILACAYNPPRMTLPMARSAVTFAEQAALRQRLETVIELHQADPAALILDLAQQYQADLVVVGNKGIGDATRFRLGGVPDQVAHAAECDVLVVDTTSGRSHGGYSKLLVGTDGSPTASEAARKALELGLLLRASVTLVYVGDPLVGAIVLEETASSAPERVKVDIRVLQGEPAAAIRQAAEDEGADLIVVGNKGMAGARRYFLGSVPNQIAHDAPADVLVAKTVDLSVDDIAPSHGGVVTVDGRNLAVYRDEEGTVHALSPRCTHMGCTVDWNDAEKTWDCPCHGSRYALDGSVIQGPAEKALAPQEAVG